MSENVVERIKKGSTLLTVRSLSQSIPALVQDRERTQELIELAEKGIKFDCLLACLKERKGNIENVMSSFKDDNVHKQSARGKVTMLTTIINIMETDFSDDLEEDEHE